MHTRFSLSLSLVFLLALAACNTMEGMGRDISGAGHAISDSADSVHRKISH
jgi:predicted small secreted protein